MTKKLLPTLAAVSLAATSLIAFAPDAAAADRTCRSSFTDTTVNGNVNVPIGATCTLTRVIVKGDIKVARGATLVTHDGRVTGNVQGENAPRAITLNRTIISGNVQTKNAAGQVYLNRARVTGDVQAERNKGLVRLYRAWVLGDVQTKYTFSRVELSTIGGNVQHEEGLTSRVVSNWINGDVQVFKNRGEQRISSNTIRGNLQCKENNPRPVGGNNEVRGSKEDQCRSL